MGQRVHAVVGGGTVAKPALIESLKDAIEDGDAVGLLWDDKTDTTEEVFDYVLDHGVEFTMYYKEGSTPHKLFRNAEHGVCQKVRNPLKAALQAVENGGAVLFLWDDDENPEDDEDEQLIKFVFDTCGDDQLVLELTNGLAPISVNPPADIPSAEEIAEIAPDDDDEDESPLANFSKEELDNMPAALVKEYGVKIGTKATTKTAIIAELFPADEEELQPHAKIPAHILEREAATKLTREVEEDSGNTNETLPLAAELRRFATAAIRLANAWEAEHKES